MNFESSSIVIYSTTDYSIFKILKGNRGVTNNRSNAIKESVIKVGYQPVPILVNERFEVIDGQGRLAVCKELGLPVYFIIKSGIGIDECIAMNIKMQNWTIYDFIQSYADQGNENYSKLLEHADDESTLNLIEIAMCLSDTSWSKNVDRPLRNGTFKLSESDINLGCLDFVKSIAPVLNQIRGGHQQYIPVLVGLYKMDLIDDVHMKDHIKKHFATMSSAYNIDEALEQLQNVYNYRSPKSKIKRFRDEYLNKMEQKGARYSE